MRKIIIPERYKGADNAPSLGWLYQDGRVITPYGVKIPLIGNDLDRLMTHARIDGGVIMSRLCVGMIGSATIILIEGTKEYTTAISRTRLAQNPIPVEDLVIGYRYMDDKGEDFTWLGTVYRREFINGPTSPSMPINLQTRDTSFTAKMERGWVIRTKDPRAVEIVSTTKRKPNLLAYRHSELGEWADQMFSYAPIPKTFKLSQEISSSPHNWGKYTCGVDMPYLRDANGTTYLLGEDLSTTQVQVEDQPPCVVTIHCGKSRSEIDATQIFIHH